MTSNIPPPLPLVRTIAELRWWSAAVYLDQHPDIPHIDASPPRYGWTWQLARTSYTFVYQQLTFHNGTLITRITMDTKIPDRDAFIAFHFPS